MSERVMALDDAGDEVYAAIAHVRRSDGDASVLDGVVAIETSRRNAVVAVVPAAGQGRLFKRGVGHAGERAVVREAGIYDLMAAHAPTFAHAPRRLGFDAIEGRLVLECPRGARTLAEDATRAGVAFARRAAALGLALGTLHTLPAAARDAFPLAPMPWAFDFHHPTLTDWRMLSAASRRIVGIVRQSPPFSAALEGLTAEWRVDAPIHGDLRWGNCVVTRRPARLYLVDWEFAGLGDSAWDIGCAFAACLRTWLRSVPFAGDEPPDRYLHLARTPLARLQPAVAALWAVWAARVGAGDDALVRAVRYAGARLAHAALEAAQEQARLDGLTVVQLQLALNVLLHPADAAERLLGLARP